MSKSKQKRNSSQNIDRKLNRTLIILSIITCIIFIVGSIAAWGLTTVLNDPPAPAITANVRIYNNGIYYTQDTFRDATVNGTITFVATITSGSPTAVWVDVYPETDTQGSGSPVLTRQMVKDSPYPGQTTISWRINLDTTQLENGIYWFFVRATDGNSAKITLSIFGFSQSSSGGEGEVPPLQIATAIVLVGLVIILVGGGIAVIMYVMKMKRR